MRGIIGKLEMVVLGRAPRRLEWVDVRDRPQRTRQGGQMCAYNKRTGSEGNRHGTRDESGVTEHPGRASGRDVDVTPKDTAGECGRGVYTGG